MRLSPPSVAGILFNDILVIVFMGPGYKLFFLIYNLPVFVLAFSSRRNTDG